MYILTDIMRIRLTEHRLRDIIREEIDAVNNNGQYIYHAIGDLNDLPSILRNGLSPNRWDGIFFRKDKRYNERSTALLGVRLTEENIAKYNIRSYGNVCFAYKTILPSDIEIIDCCIGEGYDPQSMMASQWAEMPTASDEICYEVFKCIGLKFLYEDICRYFFDESFIERLKSFGIKFTNLL